jgi:HAD superfamily hydrolase (TIGR01549 family)
MSARLTGPIRAVLFDVDGTLYLQPPLRMAMACELAVTSLATGWARQPHDVPLLRAFRRVREQLRADDGSPEPLASRQYTAVSAGIGCHPTDVERAVAEWIHRRPLKWLRFCRRRGLDRFFEFLSARGVRCGVFSDYPVREKLVALRLADRFDLMLSAVDREVDAFKPNPRGFLRASERWGIPVREIVYVGDRSEVDAVGAASAGMQCAVLTTRRPRGNAAFVAVADFRELQRVLDPVC